MLVVPRCSYALPGPLVVAVRRALARNAIARAVGADVAPTVVLRAKYKIFRILVIIALAASQRTAQANELIVDTTSSLNRNPQS